jgi:hypothetical protein
MHAGIHTCILHRYMRFAFVGSMTLLCMRENYIHTCMYVYMYTYAHEIRVCGIDDLVVVWCFSL